jgi:hypothetical protein
VVGGGVKAQPPSSKAVFINAHTLNIGNKKKHGADRIGCLVPRAHSSVLSQSTSYYSTKACVGLVA